MKKENTPVVKVKNIKRNKIISYISLFVLIILLVLPPFLRAFVKEKEPEKINVIEVLSCSKEGESVSSSFLNGTPRNITYKRVGDYTIGTAPDEMDSSAQLNTSGQVGVMETPTDGATVENSGTQDQSTVQSQEPVSQEDAAYEELLASDYIELVRLFSNISYNAAENMTVVSTDMQTIQDLVFYKEMLFSSDRQQYYFSSKGFVCSVTRTESKAS